MELLYEGKSKRMFEIEDPFVLKVEYKDEVTTADGRKRGEAPGKGRLSNIITSEMFDRLESSRWKWLCAILLPATLQKDWDSKKAGSSHRRCSKFI